MRGLPQSAGGYLNHEMMQSGERPRRRHEASDARAEPSVPYGVAKSGWANMPLKN